MSDSNKNIARISESDIQGIVSELQSRAKTFAGNIYVYQYQASVGKKRDRTIPANVKVFEGTEEKAWAVRIEGQKQPVRRRFDTFDLAKKYAKDLILKGRGRKLMVIKS